MSYAKNRGSRSKPKLSPQTADIMRAKIDVTMCLNKLSACIRGEPGSELRSDQLMSAKLLLERSLPSLSQQEVKSTQTSYVARLPAVAPSAEAWAAAIAAEKATEAQGSQVSASPVPDSQAKH